MALTYSKKEDDFAKISTLKFNIVEDTVKPKRFLPAEWFPQSGVQLTWPNKDTDWNYILDEVVDCYKKMAFNIASREHLLIVAADVESVRSELSATFPSHVFANITFAEMPINDTWARDHGFITVITDESPLLMDYTFNGWGMKFAANLDNQINKTLYNNGFFWGKYCNNQDFVLEGGSIESDGCGTLLVTSECLLSENRNSTLSKEQIESRLKHDFCVERVLWLDHGYLSGDDTDSHIDTLARLCPNDTITYVRCTDKDDEHFEELNKMEEQLKQFKTSDGNPYRLLALPMADEIVFDGERLPATYANFLIINKAVLYPTYNQPDNDEKAKEVLQQAFPEYEIVGIDCAPLIKQHGSLHCCTMQFPKGVLIQ